MNKSVEQFHIKEVWILLPLTHNPAPGQAEWVTGRRIQSFPNILAVIPKQNEVYL